MLDEIVDVEAADIILVAAHAWNLRIVDAAKSLGTLDDLLTKQKMIGVFVIAAAVLEQRERHMRQRPVAEMVRDVVVAGFFGAARRLAESLDQ